MNTLKASLSGLALIKQARCDQGWAISDFRWLESASEVLGVSWCNDGMLAAGVSEGTWKRFLAGRSPINAQAFRAYCEVLGVDWQVVTTAQVVTTGVTTGAEETFDNSFGQSSSNSSAQSSGNSSQPTYEPIRECFHAPDVSLFYGRTAELATLQQWVVEDGCRLVTLLGMGGIGKTALSVKLAKKLTGQLTGQLADSGHVPTFEAVVWRSLRNAPTVTDLVSDLIKVLSRQQETVLPESLDNSLMRLLHYLQKSRCLLVFDNVESILQPGDRTGRYLNGYEGYGQLMRCIAETAHSSCLILTSREKPQGLAKFEGIRLPVRSLQLLGLPEADSRRLFAQYGRFTATAADWQALIARYGGNPLALKIVSSSIHDYFDGNVTQFLSAIQSGGFLFDDIRSLLAQQFQRLTPLECSVMYWVAINREPVTLSELQTDFVTTVPLRDWLAALSALQRRSLLEKKGKKKHEKNREKKSGQKGDYYTQQPVVMEYTTVRLIETVSQEILSPCMPSAESDLPASALFVSHALLKATAKDYIRETQAKLILQPIVDQLATALGSVSQISQRLQHHVHKLRGKPMHATGYAAGNLLNLLCHMGESLTDLDCSHLSIWQAYLQDRPLHGVDFTHANFSRCVFTEILGNILWVAFSPDGQTLATCDTGCRIRLWDVVSGKLLLILPGHDNWIRSLAFSPDGQTLASSGAEGLVKLWDVNSGDCYQTLQGHQQEVFAVAFSPNGQWIATGSSDCCAKLWSARTGQCFHTFCGHTDWVRTVAFSPDGAWLATGSNDCTLKLWDCATGHLCHTLEGHTGWVRAIAFHPQGCSLVSASNDHLLKHWNVCTGECLHAYTDHQGSVFSTAFSPDGTLLISGSSDHTIKIWDTVTHRCTQTLSGQTNDIYCVAFSPDGHTIATVSLDQTLRLWDARSGQCLKSWHGSTDWALPVSFQPAGPCGSRYLASGSNDYTIKLWDWQTGQYVRSFKGHTDFIYGLAFSPDGQTLASASPDTTIRLWQLEDGECLKILCGHADWTFCVAFHPHDSVLVSASADCTLKLWDLKTGQCLQTLKGHSAKIFGLAVSPDGQTIASASTDQTIRVWDYATGQCQFIFKEQTGIRAFAVDYVPHQPTPMLVSGSADHTLKLWDLQTGQCLQTLTGHRNWVFSIAASPDGSRIASAANDRTVKLWDVNTGQCLRTYTGHQHLVSAIAFSPDGHTLASGSQDQTIRLWNTDTGGCNHILTARRLYEGLKLTATTGLTPATLTTLQSLGAIVTNRSDSGNQNLSHPVKSDHLLPLSSTPLQ